ncbi:Rieske 2Fe-2S domain-containing protein [Breoghania sp.]|uniref:aromatic ring-hydroxylating oxygenase subunit alpha n=1 Tax=Breoghania sp. TaxID=2065378 RepID=UPI00263093D4|nr:Rieske 2Fe-2S domain-containing protein [Breoghania sp.]MDJ0933108.1 Rieske 2Fe-2S domain-containing protein [Breoghania sp.]
MNVAVTKTGCDYSELVSEDRVATQMYTDPDLFELEMEKIFSKTWVWVGHMSEVPEKGSFKRSWVGLQPVIISRDRKGEIHVLVNRCRHRAATVCEHDKGARSARSSVPITAGAMPLTGLCAVCPTARDITRTSTRSTSAS